MKSIPVGVSGVIGQAIARSLKPRVSINAVSPRVIEESLDAFSGIKPVPADEAALAYVRSIEGPQTGAIYRVGWSRNDT